VPIPDGATAQQLIALAAALEMDAEARKPLG
jgi:hypothetical protein